MKIDPQTRSLCVEDSILFHNAEIGQKTFFKIAYEPPFSYKPFIYSEVVKKVKTKATESCAFPYHNGAAIMETALLAQIQEQVCGKGYGGKDHGDTIFNSGYRIKYCVPPGCHAIL